jgi:hypothetical protein
MYFGCGLLIYDAVQSYLGVQTFGRNVLPPSSASITWTLNIVTRQKTITYIRILYDPFTPNVLNIFCRYSATSFSLYVTSSCFSVREKPSKRVKVISAHSSFVFTETLLQETCRCVTSALYDKFGKLAKWLSGLQAAFVYMARWESENKNEHCK